MERFINLYEAGAILSNKEKFAFFAEPIEEIGFSEFYSDPEGESVTRLFRKKIEEGNIVCEIRCSQNNLKNETGLINNSVAVSFYPHSSVNSTQDSPLIKLVFSSDIDCVKEAASSIKHLIDDYLKILKKLKPKTITIQFYPKDMSGEIIFTTDNKSFLDPSLRMYLYRGGLVITHI